MTLSIKQPWDIPDLDLNGFKYKFLAEGDSWFSIGENPPWATSNLLSAMSHEFKKNNLVINCARQGDTLSRMHQMWHDNNFTRLLDAPYLGYYWDALLLSAGGNDLIDACLVDPAETDQSKRVLLRPNEVPRNATADNYISGGGWQAFEVYLRANFADLVKRRNNGVNSKAALFLHTYSRITVRNSPAGNALFPVGPWLFTALSKYQVPPKVRQSVADALFMRLKTLLLSLANSAERIFVFDSQDPAIGVVPAPPGSKRVSNDFQNEIHMTSSGYKKVATPFAAFIEKNI